MRSPATSTAARGAFETVSGSSNRRCASSRSASAYSAVASSILPWLARASPLALCTSAFPAPGRTGRTTASSDFVQVVGRGFAIRAINRSVRFRSPRPVDRRKRIFAATGFARNQTNTSSTTGIGGPKIGSGMKCSGRFIDLPDRLERRPRFSGASASLDPAGSLHVAHGSTDRAHQAV